MSIALSFFTIFYKEYVRLCDILSSIKRSGGYLHPSAEADHSFVRDGLTCKVFFGRDCMGKYVAKAIADTMRELLKMQLEFNMLFEASSKHCAFHMKDC